MTSYWTYLQTGRVTRRRAIAAAGSAAAAAALIACGGSSKSSSSGGSSGLVTPNTDETSQAKRGGTYKSSWPTPPTQDPHGSGPGQVVFSYSTLLKFAPGHLTGTDGTLEGDIMESWEIAPDKVTVTGKITPNAHFAPVKPVNGRAVEASDVVFAWERFSSISPRRGDLANSASPAAPFVSITTPDARTIVIKLKEPTATALPLLATAGQGYFLIVPKEAADQSQLDLRNTVAGSGPYYATDISASVSTTWKRNPGYQQDKRGFPYIDQIELADLVDYPPNLVQLKSGTFFELVQGGVKAEDILPLKAELPVLEAHSAGISTSYDRTLFGQAADSPFRDERVRQAYVLTWDRDAFIDAMYSAAAFNKAGLPVSRAYDGPLPATTFDGWWLDPMGKDFGPNAKYFKQDLAEAKKLMAAAGYANGLDHDIFYAAAPGLQALFYVHAPVIIGMAKDSGLFRPRIRELNYAAEWNNVFRFNKGQFNGTALFLDSAAGDPANNLYMHYHSNGTQYFGGDSTLDDLTTKALAEFDTKKRQAIVYDIQRYEGGKMYQPRIGGATTFDLTWPALRQKYVWRGGPQALFTMWIDPDRPPLKKA